MISSLYERLGDQTIQRLVEGFYNRIYNNSKIQHLFKTEKDEVMRKQYLFLTQFFGGPSKYSDEFGHPKMRMRHMKQVIREEDKDEWLRCMFESIDDLNLDDKLTFELKAAFPVLANHMVNSR
ncbi:MAG: hypothetical protein N4A41_05290 [Crocinitomicaceae bacterium]|jgi:hemoglobin|nr:hypothetical protein [Crocinitomicaceae bacterium]